MATTKCDCDCECGKRDDLVEDKGEKSDDDSDELDKCKSTEFIGAPHLVLYDQQHKKLLAIGITYKRLIIIMSLLFGAVLIVLFALNLLETRDLEKLYDMFGALTNVTNKMV